MSYNNNYNNGGYQQQGGYGAPPPNSYGQQGSYGSSGPAPYGAGPASHDQRGGGGGSASDYYNNAPGGQQQQQQQPQQYDEHGNPVAGERGLGTMAMGEYFAVTGRRRSCSYSHTHTNPFHPYALQSTGGLAGFAANKMSGGHSGGLASIGTGALLAQGGKMAYEMFNKQKTSGHQGGYGGGGNHQQQQQGGMGGFFNKFGSREGPDGQSPGPQQGYGGPPQQQHYGHGSHQPPQQQGGGFFGKRDF